MAKILIGFESSGMTRHAFRELGHNAWSCDILPSDDKSPFHCQMDIFELLKKDMQWDLVIFHPPCTFLSSSGLHWNKRRPERAQQTEEALVVVKRLLDLPINKIALENPIGCISTRIRKPDQIIQPYWFGDNASKSTCLWLKNLPLLIPTNMVAGRITKDGKERWDNQTDSGQNRLGPSENRWKLRSATYPGFAKAMATQWSKIL